MAMCIKEVKRWLETIPDREEVAIDDGGLCLVVVNHENTYLEVGGIPEDFDD